MVWGICILDFTPQLEHVFIQCAHRGNGFPRFYTDMALIFTDMGRANVWLRLVGRHARTCQTSETKEEEEEEHDTHGQAYSGHPGTIW
eukprot:1837864-Prymnesium_polylepis.1